MPEGFQIGPLYIHYYGVIIMVGALLAAWMASWQARKRNQDPELVWDMLPWLLIAGIIGARIWHLLTPSESMVKQGITTYYYLTHPLDAIAVWKGGLGIPGAVIGGLLALYLYSKSKKQNILTWMDIIAPGLALAQAVGRWGNFVNQEIYGAPTDLPWAIYIEPSRRIPGFEQFNSFHPLFLYESIWNLLNMAALLWLGKKFNGWLKQGDLFLCYLIIYPVGRFFLEFLRLDASRVGGINANQTLMAVLALGSIALLVWRHRGSNPAEANPSQV